MVEHDQIDVTLLEDLGELDQVLERAAQAVELGDDQLVAGPVGGQQRLIEPGAPRESLPDALSTKISSQPAASSASCRRARIRLSCYSAKAQTRVIEL